MSAPTLFDPLWEHERRRVAAQARHDLTIDEQFRTFHAAHPEVYARLRELALDLVLRGHRAHVGVGMLYETCRYFTMLGADPDESPWRLNNNYRSRYARLLMEQEPELAGIFETRELRTP